MSLPELPASWEDGYSWMEQLSGGWYAVPSWGREGWDLGSWPYVIIAHYDKGGEFVYGLATYTEGDIEIKEFPARDERDKATSELAIWYWSRDEQLCNVAPTDMNDPRLRPYRRNW